MFGGAQVTIVALVFAAVGCLFCFDFYYGDRQFLESLTQSFNGMGSNEEKNTEGPWPECLWMTGVECAKHLKTQLPKGVEIEFMHKHAVNEMVSTFETNRVIITVNDFDAVQEAPARGRRRVRRRDLLRSTYGVKDTATSSSKK